MLRRAGRSILLTSLVLFCVASVSGQSHPREYQRKVLVGINAVRVVVEGLDSDAVHFGLSKDRLRTLTELRLRQSGISVSPDARPFVYVRVNLLKLDGVRGCAAHVDVRVRALVQLVHSSKTAFAAIWSEGTVLIGPSSSCKQHVEDALGELLDLFANDYLAANPR